ncbi:PREDICTED: syntaxin-8-like [Acropora digitifera]|uniref:syntaxin-8-like n=1 Tax=Acropora digitifera TaxID=70779 RepID=UPI00077A1660|nr:PREDICTED: syntaxin-8-like [Acropora digitifera]
MAMNWLPDGLEMKGKSKMAPFGEDSWLSEFKTVEKYGQDIMEKINERNKLRRNGGNYNKVQSDVRIMLKNFSKDVNNLKQSLLKASSGYEIAEREIDRRQNMLDQLITSKHHKVPLGLDFKMACDQKYCTDKQDEGLEALSGIIQRQKMMGRAISDEVDLHNGEYKSRILKFELE